MAEQLSNKRSIGLGSTILILVFALGLWSIFALINREKARDLAGWQITLGVMADGRAAAIQQWVDAQFAVLQELADNSSLQLYTRRIQEGNIDGNGDTEPAQLTYLRNLLYSSAEKSGFMDTNRSTSPIRANVAFQAVYSLTLFGSDLSIITATPGAAASDVSLTKAVTNVIHSGKKTLYDLHLNANNTPLVGFIVPIFTLQKGQPDVIGAIVGMKKADSTLFPILQSAVLATQSDEAYLVRRDTNLITYLSPLADGTAPLKRQLAADDQQLAGAYAIHAPGSFAQLLDYGGKPVLATSRALTGLPWILVQKIDAQEALSESEAHQRFLLTSLLLGLLFITALLVAAWWYGNSMRQRKLAEELFAQSQKLKEQTTLLEAINDNITESIFLLNDSAQFVFANKALALKLQSSVSDLLGKSLSAAFGTEAARKLTPHIHNCLADNITIIQELNLPIGDGIHVFTAIFTPVPYKNETNNAILVTLHDITELQEGQRRQAHLLEQLVRALMRSIDIHDPYSANHSAKTARIASAIAISMNLNEPTCKTLQTAASLCNLGKLFIPKEILTKTGGLTAEEKEIVRREADYTEDILAGINFEGPVLETILQKLEYVDGSGSPKGLHKKDILSTARILAVANSFVAMISPRAYREKYSVKEAIDTILKESESHYDRQVTAALFHVVENMINWEEWKQ